ncbi:MAG: phosphodiester glycosidase family protein [Acinetobacter towneri]
MFRSRWKYLLLSYLFWTPAAQAEIRAWTVNNSKINVDVVEVTQLSQLGLYLKDQQGKPYQQISQLQKNLQSCENMQFAMNAGMFHHNYRPVGLYIEQGQQIQKLNRQQQGWGNFLIQPNGVLAWNQQQIFLGTTQQYADQNFAASYATQSGPMLVINNQLNSRFLADSQSYKIRNGVGMKNQRLYFVISNTPVTFYQFARFFKDQLKTPNALYLDGSISTAYIPQLQRQVAIHRDLGPIFAYIDSTTCGA